MRDYRNRFTAKETRWIEDNVLIRRYGKGPIRALDESLEKFSTYIDKMNQNRARSGQRPLSTWEVIDTLERAKGIVYLPKIFKDGE